MDHTALLNERRELWEKQGYSVLTGAQNGFTLRGSGAALAGKPDLAAQRRDGVTGIGAKTGRPSPRHAVQAMIGMYALPRAVERRQGPRRSGQGACPGHVADIPAEAVDEGFIGTLGSLIRRLRPGCRPGECPAPWSAGSARSPKGTARTGWRRAPPRRELPATSSMNPREETRAMETLTLTLHKAKDTKNKVVYGTRDGSVIQSVYIDKDALGDIPPAAIQSVGPRHDTAGPGRWWCGGSWRWAPTFPLSGQCGQCT